jgi:hypothetical protein
VSKRGKIIIGIIAGLVLIVVAVVATPFIVYLVYAMFCKGPDCFP